MRAHGRGSRQRTAFLFRAVLGSVVRRAKSRRRSGHASARCPTLASASASRCPSLAIIPRVVDLYLLQIAVIEYARHVVGWTGATSEEFNSENPDSESTRRSASSF